MLIAVFYYGVGLVPIEVRMSRQFFAQSNELWGEGGEKGFIQNMIQQSKEFAGTCAWFSTLVSKQSNLNAIYKALKKVEAVEVKTIPMGQGNKTSRIIAWTYLQ